MYISCKFQGVVLATQSYLMAAILLEMGHSQQRWQTASVRKVSCCTSSLAHMQTLLLLSVCKLFKITLLPYPISFFLFGKSLWSGREI